MAMKSGGTANLKGLLPKLNSISAFYTTEKFIKLNVHRYEKKTITQVTRELLKSHYVFISFKYSKILRKLG